MIKEKIGNIFDFIAETNLTEKYFYDHKGNYPVFSGQTENNGVVAFIDNYKQTVSCITFTTYGNAGKIYYRDGKYTIGRNCTGLKLKKEFEKELDINWFSCKFQNLFYRLRIGDPKGQKSLNKILLENVEVSILDKDTQQKQIRLYKKAQNVLENINNMIEKLNNLLITNINLTNFLYEEKIEKVFDVKGGNSGLTKEFIYQNKPTNEEEKVPILSGATLKANLMGYISRNAKPKGKNLKIFSGPAILAVRKGIAGQMIYINEGEFTANDDAYVLTPKKEWEDKINLRWFVYQYQELFYNLVTSKSDNATFNKEYAEKQKVKIPDIPVQNSIVEKLIKVDKLIENSEKLKEDIEELIEYEII